MTYFVMMVNLIPDEIRYLKGKCPGKTYVRKNSVAIDCAPGTWDENTVRDLRKQFPDMKIIIREWHDDNSVKENI